MFCRFNLNVYYIRLLWDEAEACAISNLYSTVSCNETGCKKTEIVTMMSSSVGWISFMWYMKSDTWAWIYSAAHKHMLIFAIMKQRSQLFPGDRWCAHSQAEGATEAIASIWWVFIIKYQEILSCRVFPAKCVNLKINGEKIEDMQA